MFAKASIFPVCSLKALRAPNRTRGLLALLLRVATGYGCVIEAPPCHPGLMGLVLPWNDALSHRCVRVRDVCPLDWVLLLWTLICEEPRKVQVLPLLLSAEIQ